MEDIKMTLSANPRLRSPNIEEEARWMVEEGPIYYPLSGRPRRTEPGCWIYFIRERFLVARSRIDDIVQRVAPEAGHTYTGAPTALKRWTIACTSMEKAKTHVAHASFQGFRYVTDDERIRFEEAFK